MNLIVAVAKDYAIGKDNKLLFHLPSDLAFFKQKTQNKVVVMGEKTYLSLPKRPLVNRTNIVLSASPNFSEDGVLIVHSLKELFEKLKEFDTDSIFICGGASVYNLLMDYCKTAYVTVVEKIVPADTYIDDIEKRGFVLKECSQLQHENGLDFYFKTYENLNPKEF